MKQKCELGFGDSKMSGIILLNCGGDIKLTVSVLLLQSRISIWIETNVALRTSFLITKWLCSIKLVVALIQSVKIPMLRLNMG